ncbi:MAG TPA: GntR family transcriptional regulator [Longimicrobium sp.]|nr:GntR family transcriptional regulator [Longimicrobium sp.]
MAARKDPYHALKTMVVRGHIAPGLRLTENDIAARMGVSRTPAREALRRLRADGLLVVRGAGRRTEFAVAPLTREDLVEVYEAMAALEGMAARRVERLAAGERRALAARMRTAERGLEAAAKADPRAYDQLFERHNAFHRELVDAAAGNRLRELLAVVAPQADRYEWMYAPMVGPDHSATFAEHRAIVAAVRAGTADELEAAVRANWLNSATRLLAALDRWGARGEWVLPPGDG